MAKLMAFLGHDDILRITEEDAERWRDYRQAAGISPSTIAAADLAGPRTILNWAVSNRSLPIKHNPFLGVRIKVRKRIRLRERGFTLSEAETILKATLADQGPKISITGAAARRWVPWLAAYSGARVNELTQLRHADIIQERTPDGEPLWCMRITPESGTVKTDAARVVPLHPHVIEQGFLAYVGRRQNLPLFFEPSLVRKANAAHRQADKVGERLAAWVRALGVPDGVQPNHGWRHRFRTIGRSLRIADSMMNAIDGHATESIADAYGDYVIKAMHEAISVYPAYTI
ncbi:hypothetical protein [Pelagibacterium sp.]|uniref:hypothetical protein n=1 Tax=Pelagibacterium sp. TaxID=1967288 RepID=UPI003A8DC513